MNDHGPQDPVAPEILDPDDPAASGNDPYVQNILALVDSYTDRPDLLIAEIEKHDPGFVKRMNEASEHDSKQLRDERFRFGKTQAYISLGVSVVGALAMLGAILVAVFQGSGFWTIIALAIAYAITQGGTHGFGKVIEGLQSLLQKKPDQ